jgi:hypothetical protein
MAKPESKITEIVRTERFKRGVAGRIWKLSFIAFNLAMAAWTATSLYAIFHPHDRVETADTGSAIGSGVVIFLTLIAWALGALVLGVMSFLTRGGKVTVEEPRR